MLLGSTELDLFKVLLQGQNRYVVQFYYMEWVSIHSKTQCCVWYNQIKIIFKYEGSH